MTTLLLVDDDPATLEALNESLRPHYQTRIALRGERALELARIAPQPDLILLDVELPDCHGHEICADLKDDRTTRDIPVIFLSSHDDTADVTRGLEIGAVDYVSKPLIPAILLARVRTQLRLREAQRHLTDRNAHLEWLVQERTRDLRAISGDLKRSQELAIVALGSLAETRDNETGNHIHRTRGYVEILARAMARRPSYRNKVSTAEWEIIWKSAPLHDIGKVGIPDSILLKPGRLTDDEFAIMKGHTTLGRDAIVAAENRAHDPHSFLEVAAQIAYSHHERWDGNGYPEGLSGTQIPIAARLMAVADVYDALISRRVYKAPIPQSEALDILRGGRATQFDPDVLDCFLDQIDECHKIALHFSDSDACEVTP